MAFSNKAICGPSPPGQAFGSLFNAISVSSVVIMLGNGLLDDTDTSRQYPAADRNKVSCGDALAQSFFCAKCDSYEHKEPGCSRSKGYHTSIGGEGNS